MSEPLVSVIMPAYNASPYIGLALQSVLSQTFQDFEIIVADDKSTDATLNVALGYAATDPRVHVLALPSNSGGAARPRNEALKHAKGRYIAFLDADDLWLPEKLERQISFMQSRDAALCYTAYRRITPDGGTVGEKLHRGPDRLDLHGYLRNTCIGLSTAMLDRQKTGDIRFNEGCKTAEDFDLWTRILKNHDARFLDTDLMRYRRGHASVSSNIAKSAFRQAGTYARLSREIGILPAVSAFLGYGVNAIAKRMKY